MDAERNIGGRIPSLLQKDDLASAQLSRDRLELRSNHSEASYGHTHASERIHAVWIGS